MAHDPKVFKNTSWGRTRSPKNILSSHRAGTSAAGATLTVPTSALAGADLTDSSQAYVVGPVVTNNSSKQEVFEIFGVDKILLYNYVGNADDVAADHIVRVGFSTF